MSFIRELQKKPYAVRIRILWGIVIVAAFILGIVWKLTWRYRPVIEQNPSGTSGFKAIWDNLNQLKTTKPRT